VGGKVGAPARGDGHQYFSGAQALRLAVGHLGPGRFGFDVDVEPVGLPGPGGGHVQGLAGHAHADQGVGGGHGPALGRKNSAGVTELDVLGHVTGRQQNFTVSIYGPHRHGPILMGGSDDKAVPVAHPLAVGKT
jgi:hypothetical protein